MADVGPGRKHSQGTGRNGALPFQTFEQAGAQHAGIGFAFEHRFGDTWHGEAGKGGLRLALFRVQPVPTQFSPDHLVATESIVGNGRQPAVLQILQTSQILPLAAYHHGGADNVGRVLRSGRDLGGDPADAMLGFEHDVVARIGYQKLDFARLKRLGKLIQTVVAQHDAMPGQAPL